jgi:hypothetical protein
MQQFLKPMAGVAGTQVVATELLDEFLVSVDDSIATADMSFGRVTPSSACYSARKQESSSVLSLKRMMDLL